MKEIIKFIASSLFVIVVSLNITSCGGKSASSNTKSKVEWNKIFEVVKQEYDKYGVVYYIQLKNISSRTFNDCVPIKIKYKNGTTNTAYPAVPNLAPNEVKQISINAQSGNEYYCIESWSFAE